MPAITLSGVAFHYSAPYCEVFEDLSITIDTHWRTGLIGRNGRGKSTLLGLITNELSPVKGHVNVPVRTVRIDSAVTAASGTVLDIARDRTGPFTAWLDEMQRLLDDGSELALIRYGELQEQYAAAGGYEVDSFLMKELLALGINNAELQSYEDLSLGQQTRVEIATLFVRQKLAGQRCFPLIDEPTNHLDMSGRQMLGDYLASQTGFLLVSHDRALLDQCTDHTLAINRDDVTVTQGNWSTWKQQQERTLLHESRERNNIEGQVQHLKKAAAGRRQHAGSKEKEKYGHGVFDKGFIGHRAAKQMKRALAAERRIEQQLQEKEGLLKNQEKERSLSVMTDSSPGKQVLIINNINVSIGDRLLIDNFSLAIETGERIALTGPNGCGKTTLLRAILEQHGYEGTIRRNTAISVANQHASWSEGTLRDYLRQSNIDETRFRQFLGVMDVRGETFEQPLTTFSQGQLKKVELCRSLLEPAGLLVWDEPMNYLDVDTREMLESAIIADNPTMLFVEHDKRFVDTVATRIIDLS